MCKIENRRTMDIFCIAYHYAAIFPDYDCYTSATVTETYSYETLPACSLDYGEPARVLVRKAIDYFS